MLLNLRKKLKESFFSVFPIVMIVLAISLLLGNIPGPLFVKFIISAFLLFLGIGFFSLGADQSMMPIGQNIASTLTKKKKVWLLLLACLLMGFIITIAEPDLAVLANQIPSINKWVFICVVGIGIGICFVLGAIRILFGIPIAYLLTAGYVLIFTFLAFVPQDFWAVSFDASGVTTGAISVPFIMSFCLGISAIRGGNSNEEDSFGLVAICSMGPILSVLLLGMLSSSINITQTTTTITTSTYATIPSDFLLELLHSMQEIAIVMIPIIVVFFIFQFSMIHLPKTQIIKICIGLVYTYVGIVLFMTGVNVGFSQLGSLLGEYLTLSKYSWIIYPIAFVLGYVIVCAEPAVHVLTEQVADISGNTISKKVLRTSFSIGVAISLTLAVIRAVFQLNILYFLLPMYVVALGLSFYNFKLFTAVGFDAGGIASGPMSATFLLPFVTGITTAHGGNIMYGAFGTVALIATTPIVVIQILGAIAKYAKTKRQAPILSQPTDTISIIEYDYE